MEFFVSLGTGANQAARGSDLASAVAIGFAGSRTLAIPRDRRRSNRFRRLRSIIIGYRAHACHRGRGTGHRGPPGPRSRAAPRPKFARHFGDGRGRVSNIGAQPRTEDVLVMVPENYSGPKDVVVCECDDCGCEPTSRWQFAACAAFERTRVCRSYERNYESLPIFTRPRRIGAGS